MELKLILTMLRRWAWLLVLGAIVGGGAGYVISVYQTPEYEATTKILVMEPLGNSSVSKASDLKSKELAQTYVELLFTQPILNATAEIVGAPVSVRQIRALQVSDTGLLEVTVRDTNPQQAALIANTLVEVLIESNESLQMSRFASSEQSLEVQVRDIEQELASLQNDIASRAEQDVAALEMETQVQKAELEQRIFELQGEITRLQQDIEDLTPDALPNQLPPPLTTEQRIQLNEKRTELAQKQFVLDLATESYYKLVLPIRASDADAAGATQIQNIEQANLDLYRDLYSTLLTNYEAVRLARLQNTPNVVQVEVAAPSPIPIQPGPLRNIILGAVIGLLATGSLAFMIEYMDDTIKSPTDVNSVLGLPVVGYVVNEPGMEKSEGQPYVAVNPRSPMAETFRTLRTNLEFASVDAPLKTILVTSPGTSEGKTTVATNLAAVMAQANKRVILLEGDLRRPRVHKALGMSNHVGLSDVFRGQSDIRDVARYSKIKDLAVITSGSLPPNPAELLGSARMAQILARLTESASVVIIDSPPFVVTDSTVLAAKVDGVLLVLQQGKTHAEAARAMLEQLNRAGAHVVGVVLNRVPRKSASFYGGYYYRYDSDVYSIESEEPATESGSRSRGLGNVFGRQGGAKIGEETA